MTKTRLTLTIVTAAILAAPAAFAAEHQAGKAVAPKVVRKPSTVRQAYGAVQSHEPAKPADSVAVGRPPAQPGAW